jgi:tetratricopeptide (TPR) repeat protein
LSSPGKPVKCRQKIAAEQLLKSGAAQVGPKVEQVLADPFLYQEAFKEALAYSLLRRQAREGTVSMHRLVQAVVRAQLEEASQRVWAERVVRLVAEAFPDSRDFANWEQCQRLLPHVLDCAGNLERWGFCFPEGPSLLNQAGEYLRQRAQYGAALSLVQRALAIREQTLGPDHPDLAQSLNNLATIYLRQGQFSEALPLFQRALAIR